MNPVSHNQTDQPILPLNQPLPLTNDFVFKKVFGEHKDVLASFLASVTDLPPDEFSNLSYDNTHSTGDAGNYKECIYDIKVSTNNRHPVNVEIQVRNHPWFLDRVQFYAARLYSGQLKSGNLYGLLKKAVSIIIVDFVLIDDEHWCHNLVWYDKKRNWELPGSSEIILLELPKVGKAKGPLADWLRLIHAKTNEEYMQVARQRDELMKAYGIIQTLSCDAGTRYYAEMREKALRDQMAREDDAYNRGRMDSRREADEEIKNILIAADEEKKSILLAADEEKKSILLAADEEKKNILRKAEAKLDKVRQENALAMLKNNLPYNVVSSCSGLTIEEVERLASGIKCL